MIAGFQCVCIFNMSLLLESLSHYRFPRGKKKKKRKNPFTKLLRNSSKKRIRNTSECLLFNFIQTGIVACYPVCVTATCKMSGEHFDTVKFISS